MGVEEGEEEGAHERMLASLRGGKKGPHRAVVVSEAQDEDAYNLNPETSTAGEEPKAPSGAPCCMSNFRLLCSSARAPSGALSCSSSSSSVPVTMAPNPL